MAPVFADLAKKFTDLIFLKVDVDELKPVAEEWEVDAMPTFLISKDGKKVHKLVGARIQELAAAVEQHAATVATA